MPHLSDFSALLFDVDGTLANLDYEITAQTQTALKAVQVAKYVTGICTGRHYAQMGEYVLGNFPPESLHVVSGGAQVIKQNGEVVWEKTLLPETSQKILDELQNQNLGFLTHYGKFSYSTEDVRNWFRRSLPGVNTVQPIAELPNQELPIIVVFQPTPTFIQFLNQQDDISYKELLSKKHGQYLDITARGVNKAFGLQEWSKLSNIPLTKVIGFGDSNNDLEFLQSVGWSVGMGNSTPEIKAVVKKVINHVNEHGLATYLTTISTGASL